MAWIYDGASEPVKVFPFSALSPGPAFARTHGPMVLCHRCGKSSEFGDRIGREETCPHCGWDLHVCFNCQHYERSAYNECRETQAERVLEKDKANFCDLFLASDHSMRAAGNAKADDAKAKLDALFKKK